VVAFFVSEIPQVVKQQVLEMSPGLFEYEMVEELHV